MRRLAPVLAVALLAAACGDTTPPFFVETLIASDTRDGTGAYGVTTVVRDDRRVTWVRLSYQVGLAAAPITFELTPGEASDLWLGRIPGPGRQTRIYYYLEASDEDGNLGRDPALAPDTYSFAVQPRPPVVPELDAGSPDATPADARTDAATDARVEDAPTEDAAGEDARRVDAGSLEAGPLDASGEDAAAPDASAQDIAPADSTSDA